MLHCFVYYVLRTYRVSGHVLVNFNAYEYSIKIDQSGLRKCWHLFVRHVFIG